jgi:hypothetical protein
MLALSRQAKELYSLPFTVVFFFFLKNGEMTNDVNFIQHEVSFA